MTNSSWPRQYDSKPSVGIIPRGVGVIPAHLAGASSGCWQWYGLKPLTTMISRKRDVSGETERHWIGGEMEEIIVGNQHGAQCIMRCFLVICKAEKIFLHSTRNRKLSLLLLFLLSWFGDWIGGERGGNFVGAQTSSSARWATFLWLALKRRFVVPYHTAEIVSHRWEPPKIERSLCWAWLKVWWKCDESVMKVWSKCESVNNFSIVGNQ